jgi:hypothetical protein
MKSSLGVILFLFAFWSLGAQVSFIDLRVTDTLAIKYKSITYQVRAVVPRELEGSVGENADYQAQEKIMQSMLKDSEKQLRAFLDENKLTYKPTEDAYTINQLGLQTPYFEMKFTKEEELKKFVKLLGSHNFAEGNICNVVYNFSDDFDIKLLERLSKKARDRAAKIAQLANATLGKVLEIEEIPAAAATENSYGYNVEEGGVRSPYENPNSLSLTNYYSKTLRMKFELIAK